jgi:hypothetical protein
LHGQAVNGSKFKDWLWIADLAVALIEQEACEFKVDTNQYEALKSHVEYVKGERLSHEVVPLEPSTPEEREVWRDRGIAGWSAGRGLWVWHQSLNYMSPEQFRAQQLQQVA